MDPVMNAAAETIWHDVECGGYEDDLPGLERLASRHGGPILEVGAGTGRVALHLARRGHRVDAIDLAPRLVAALAERAAAEGLDVTARVGDVRALDAGAGAYPLVIGATQLIQLLGGPAGRADALEGIARALAPDGVAALAIVEGPITVGDDAPEVLPDVREVGGYVHSSLPLGIRSDNALLEIHRLRQTVAPDGSLSEAEHTDRLDLLDAATLVAEAGAAGLEPAGVIAVAESERYVGSSIVLLRKEP
jgi:SAM-dependent methyltransferase